MRGDGKDRIEEEEWQYRAKREYRVNLELERIAGIGVFDRRSSSDIRGGEASPGKSKVSLTINSFSGSLTNSLTQRGNSGFPR